MKQSQAKPKPSRNQNAARAGAVFDAVAAGVDDVDAAASVVWALMLLLLLPGPAVGGAVAGVDAVTLMTLLFLSLFTPALCHPQNLSPAQQTHASEQQQQTAPHHKQNKHKTRIQRTSQQPHPNTRYLCDASPQAKTRERHTLSSNCTSSAQRNNED